MAARQLRDTKLILILFKGRFREMWLCSSNAALLKIGRCLWLVACVYRMKHSLNRKDLARTPKLPIEGEVTAPPSTTGVSFFNPKTTIALVALGTSPSAMDH